MRQQDLTAAMTGYQAGEAEAYRRLYDSLAPELLRVTECYAADRHSAEELLEETFLHIHCARRTWNGVAPVQEWALAIARHVCETRVRAQRRTVTYRRRRSRLVGLLRRFARPLAVGLLFVAIVLAVGTTAVGQSETARPPAVSAAEERIWLEYQDFIKGKDGPAKATAYRRSLVAGGMSEQQAWERIFLIDRLRVVFRQAAWTDHFNGLYTSPQDVFTTEPNAFLASVIDGLRPGSALDVSMGQGRNTVFLAKRGWKATGFDPAEEGLAAARTAAARAGVRIDAINSTYDAFDFGADRWDLVVFCYAFAPLSDASLVARVYKSLRPGGVVVVEHPMNEPDQAMHPHDRRNALPAAFGTLFRVVFYQDTTGISEWQQSTTSRERDRRRMVRLVARKEVR